MIYDTALFQRFAKENKLVLLHNYENEKVNSNTLINGTCTYENCGETYEKRFGAMYLYSIYCKKCTKINSRNKYKETCLERYGCVNTFQNETFKEKSKATCLKKYGVDVATKCKDVQDKYKKTCLKKYGVENCFQNETCKEKSKKTCLQKYGSQYAMQCEEFKEKSKETCLLKYGVENASQYNEFKEKSKATSLEKYGVDNPAKCKEVQDKYKQTCLIKYGCENAFQNEEIKEKIRESCLEKYGVENPKQCKEVQDKTKETNLERYGCEFASQNEDVKQKVKDTCMKNFGVEYSLQSKEVRQKGIETCLKKYGTRNPMQNAQFAENVSKRAYTIKAYIMPSGKVISLQGFENFCMDDLLQKENIDEDDIISDRSKVPKIWYNDENGVSRRHFVDFFIPSQNRCIEVKSTWTLEKNREKVFEKQNAAKLLGLKYEILVYDGDGKILEKFI